MKLIKLSEYGPVLTGREFGADVWTKISKQLALPAGIDFDGVETIGSSFGDEVLPKLAKMQDNAVTVVNANNTIRGILKDIAKDAGIQIHYGSGSPS